MLDILNMFSILGILRLSITLSIFIMLNINFISTAKLPAESCLTLSTLVTSDAHLIKLTPEALT
jgi:hypothetical protein